MPFLQQIKKYGQPSTIFAKLKQYYLEKFLDSLEGSSNKDVVIDFIKKHTEADGIISTKAHMIKSAKTHGIYAIHRFFLVDSMSFHNLSKLIAQSQPNCIEILPL